MWFKVDDQLHDHRKARAARKAAMGVWVLAGSWCADKATDGFVPHNVLPRWGNKVDAKSLVDAGLWSPTERNGESGWQFHDWSEFQPSAAVTEALKAKAAESGRRGNHRRWHVDKGISDPNCEYCYRVPDREPDWVGDTDPIGDQIGFGSGKHRPEPEPEPNSSSSNEEERRADVERVCQHLSDSLKARGVKKHQVTEVWRKTARLLIDRDDYTPDQIIWLIDRAAADDFWSRNVLSMPTLRKQADRLVLQFKPTTQTTAPRTRHASELTTPPDGMDAATYNQWLMATNPKHRAAQERQGVTFTPDVIPGWSA